MLCWTCDFDVRQDHDCKFASWLRMQEFRVFALFLETNVCVQKPHNVMRVGPGCPQNVVRSLRLKGVGCLMGMLLSRFSKRSFA